MDMTALGSILTIAIIGIVYFIFSQMDNKNADKYVDRHVKKVMADVELQKLKVKEEDLRLKKEFLDLQKTQLLGHDNNRPVNATYKIIDEIEDKSEGASGQ